LLLHGLTNLRENEEVYFLYFVYLSTLLGGLIKENRSNYKLNNVNWRFAWVNCVVGIFENWVFSEMPMHFGEIFGSNKIAKDSRTWFRRGIRVKG